MPNKAKEAAQIERDCGLKQGTLFVRGDELHFQPSPNEKYENVDCALARLKKTDIGGIGFVGNEADPNALLGTPLRYIAEGPAGQIAALSTAAQADKWVVIRTATAPDGVAILEFQTGPSVTNGQASKLLDRIWKKEFGDLGFGRAPRKISEPDALDD